MSSSASASSSESNVCHYCQEVINTSQFIRVGNYKFHKDHFLCSVCKTSLHGQKFHHKDSKFYCAKDYVDLYCQTCRSCKQKITSGSVIQAFGGFYHPDHFVCTVCSQPFKNGKYYENDNQPYCETHYFALTAEKCEQCGQGVKDTDLVRVQGKPYHNHCLSCSHCGQALAKKGSIFQKDGKVYCKQDYLDFFCKRCTACGDHILKHCISVNDEYYHPECLKCSLPTCQKKLDKYICITGHLRCADHTDSPCDKFHCFVCNRLTDEDVVLSVGKKIHPDCYKCAFCSKALLKSTAKLKDDKLCCPECLMKKPGMSVTVSAPSGASSPQSIISPNSTSGKSSAPASGRRPSVGADSKNSDDEDEASVSSAGGSSSLKPADKPKRKASRAGTGSSSSKIEFKKGELIGKGSFGKVYMAMNSATGELIAVKQVRLNTSEEQEQAIQIQNEIGLMENLRHPNIVALLGTQRSGNKLNIIMEYVPGKSLDSLLEKFGAFSEKVIRSYTKQLLLALEYCHSNRIVHRDIKGKNILIDTRGNLKLADWGSAKRFQNVMSKDAPSLSYNYTPLWTAPEVLVGDYNAKVDIWSTGCVIIEMASAKPPWSEQNFENPFRALYHIGNSDAVPKIPDTLSDVGKDFILYTLRRDPDKRPTATECLQHEWLQGLEDLGDAESGSDYDSQNDNDRPDDSGSDND